MSKPVTRPQADSVLRAVEDRYSPWIRTAADGPVVEKGYMGAPYAIVWEGGPFGWALHGPASVVDQELGKLHPLKHTLKVWTEPLTSYALGIYRKES